MDTMIVSLKRTAIKFGRDALGIFGASAAAQGLFNQSAPDWHAIWIAATAALGIALYRIGRDAAQGKP